MIRQTLRPLARSAALARPRPYPSSSSRLFSSSGPHPSPRQIGAFSILTAGITAFGVAAYLRSPARAESSVPRDTVLDAKSLKENIHKRNPAPAGETPPHIVSDKANEAKQSMESGNKASEGAFNEETGEINWDCPCLGGMADGPCGENFKAAFSCFVFSEAEPKGVDCVDKFKMMQDCFREHPDIYGEEIDDDESAPADISPMVDRPVPKTPEKNPKSRDDPKNLPQAHVTLSTSSRYLETAPTRSHLPRRRDS